jgi:HSP20 family protein
MAIQRWDPLRDLMQLQEKMNSMFEEALSRAVGPDGAQTLASAGWKPPLDLIEEPERYILRADVPGVSAGDVDIKVEEGDLVLRGERRMEEEISREAFLRIERPYGEFHLQIALPTSVDPSLIQATHRDGVIEIVLPKKKESLPTRIEISTD